jgi:hypothetical protein
MCDIFNAKCKVCGKKISIHLGDYLTGRNEIEVFCPDHLPKENVVLFHFENRGKAEKRLKKEKKYLDKFLLAEAKSNIREFAGRAVGIRPLTENARKYTADENYNHPNVIGICYRKEVVPSPQGLPKSINMGKGIVMMEQLPKRR